LGGNFTLPLLTRASVGTKEIKERVAAADRAIAQYNDAIVATFDAVLNFNANSVETVPDHNRARQIPEWSFADFESIPTRLIAQHIPQRVWCQNTDATV
jgi:hypothetical protein